MMIPDEKIAEVRERAGIVEVISDYIPLKKSGANFQGLCPFHGEKTPSFNVNPARGIFHCFGCGVGGNAVTFVMKMEGISFPEAVKLLAKRVGVEIEERLPTPSEIKRKNERDELLAIVSLAADYYYSLLVKGSEGAAARSYLAGRGVDDGLFASYRLGAASEKWEGLANFLKQKGVSLEHVEKLGLVKKKNGGGYFDLFRNRLMFTIADVHGQPVGFGGRVLDNSLPKYINSPESLLYQKSDALFGVDLAKQAMREERVAIIVEGYFDHLALYRHGIRNVVATCGTALTKGHLQLIRRYAEKIYLLFDSDSAGRKATLRAMELLLSEQVPCFVIEMAEGDDPDSYLGKHTAADFLELMKGSRPALDYYLRELITKEDTGSVAGKMAVVDQFRPFLLKLADPLERDLYLKELSRLLAVDIKTLGAPERTASANAGKNHSSKIRATHTDSLVALLFRYPEIASDFRQSGTEELLPEELKKCAALIIDAAARGEKVEPTVLIEASGEASNTFAAILMDDSHLEAIDPFKAFRDYRRALEKDALKMSDAKSLRRELLQLEYDSPRYMEILEKLNSLRNVKSQLL